MNNFDNVQQNNNININTSSESSGDPAQRIIVALKQSISDEGVSLDEILCKTGLNRDITLSILTSMVENGTAFHASDDNHWTIV